jgi:WD40 repeat protein
MPAPAGVQGRTIWSVAAGELPDGRLMLAAAGNDWKVYRWDAVTGEQLGPPLAGHTSSVKAVTVLRLPDGSVMIASAGDDCTVRRWNAVAGSPLGPPMERHRNWVTRLAVMPVPNGMTLLASCDTGDTGGVVQRWDPSNGTPVGLPWRAHRGWGAGLIAARIAGRPELITVGLEDEVIRRWDARNGSITIQPLQPPPDHPRRPSAHSGDLAAARTPSAQPCQLVSHERHTNETCPGNAEASGLPPGIWPLYAYLPPNR